jgi:hypothetical protein
MLMERITSHLEIRGQIRIYVPRPWQRHGDSRDDKANPIFLAYSPPMRDENSPSKLSFIYIKMHIESCKLVQSAGKLKLYIEFQFFVPMAENE